MAQPVKGILLDIEGTTSSITFVHDVMFPFVLERLDRFLDSRWNSASVQEAAEQIALDAGQESIEVWARQTGLDPETLICQEVRRLMASDVKATGLKALQGIVWKDGFESGELKAHVYPDVLPAIEQWRDAGIDVRIYSSGSIAAQKLFFGHLDGYGNRLDLFSGHYDTTIGSKKEAESYRRIAEDWGLGVGEILFVSDIAGELEAAQQAGLQTRGSMRPGNAELPTELECARIASFDEIRP